MGAVGVLLRAQLRQHGRSWLALALPVWWPASRSASRRARRPGAFAVNFGVVPVSVVRPVPLILLAAAVLLATVLLAVPPALLAARARPADLLRTE